MAETNPNPTATVHEEKEGKGDRVLFFNATRHKHELCFFEGLPAYKCSGCHEYGANLGYKCTHLDSSAPCKNFTLHEACATLPDLFQHPFRCDAIYKFRSKTHMRHQCNACQEVVRGFVFQTEKHDVRLHPLCMALPAMLGFSGHANHKLKFLTGNLKGKAYTCSACDSQIDSGGWRYRCEEVTCKVYVDPACAKIDIFGLSNYGIERITPVSRGQSVATFVASVLSTASQISGIVQAVQGAGSS